MNAIEGSIDHTSVETEHRIVKASGSGGREVAGGGDLVGAFTSWRRVLRLRGNIRSGDARELQIVSYLSACTGSAEVGE